MTSFFFKEMPKEITFANLLDYSVDISIANASTMKFTTMPKTQCNCTTTCSPYNNPCR